MNPHTDEQEFVLLTSPGASLSMSIGDPFEGLPQIHVLGNREGMLSLANVLLWLRAHCFEREILSLTALPFIRAAGNLALTIRVTLDDSDDDYGSLHRLDRDCQYEWRISEDDLMRLALTVHGLASVPEHGYDRLPVKQVGDAWIWLELLSNQDRPQIAEQS